MRPLALSSCLLAGAPASPLALAGAPAPVRRPRPFATSGAGVGLLSGSGAAALAALPTGGVAVGTFGSGAWAFDPAEEQTPQRLLDGASATCLVALSGGCLAAGGDGLRLINLSHPEPPRSARLALDVEGINSILELANGGLAVGADSGLYVLAEELLRCGERADAPPRRWPNASAGPPPPVSGPLAERFVYALTELPGGLAAAGTDRGVFLLDAAGLRGPSAEPLAVLAPDAHVASLLPLPDGGLAAGTLDGALLFAAAELRAGGQPRAALARGSAVWALAVASGGGLLVGTSAWGGPAGGDRGALLFGPDQWASSGGRPAAAMCVGTIVWSLAVLPGDVLAVGGSDGVKLFHLEGEQGDAAPVEL